MSSQFHAQVFYGIVLPRQHEQGDEDEVLKELKLVFPSYNDCLAVAIKESVIEVNEESNPGTWPIKELNPSEQGNWNHRLFEFCLRLGRKGSAPGWFFSAGQS